MDKNPYSIQTNNCPACNTVEEGGDAPLWFVVPIPNNQVSQNFENF